VTVIGLAIAAAALVVALLAVRSARATSRSLAADAVVQKELAVKSEQTLLEVTARCTSLEQQAAQAAEATKRQVSDVEAHLDDEIAALQSTGQVAAAAGKAGRQRLAKEVTRLREMIQIEVATARAEAQAERAVLAQQLDAGLAQVQDALSIEVAVQVATLRKTDEPQRA
jgi:hypothetical protein